MRVCYTECVVKEICIKICSRGNQEQKCCVGVKAKKERSREDAGAAMPNQQMRSTVAPYPFDRYLVESRKEIDTVNIIDEDIWHSEPTLRPEDEIILRKLHDMLQSTADDLKLLSGELSKYREPGIQVKTLAMPLDEEFNDKAHIADIVEAKFYGNKLVDSSHCLLKTAQKGDINDLTLSVNNKKIKGSIKDNVQINDVSPLKKQQIKKNLRISHTKTMDISPNDNQDNLNHVIFDDSKKSKCLPSVCYSEFSYKYVKPSSTKSLKIQEMPSVNIRSELTLQKVLQLDILPENNETSAQKSLQHNTLVLEMQHELQSKQKDNTYPNKFVQNQYVKIARNNKPTTRKVSTMAVYESSESNNISSDYKLRKNKHKISIAHGSQKILAKTRKNITTSNERNKSPSRAYLNEWKKKLNIVYGRPLYETNKKKVSCKNYTKKLTSKDKTKENNHNKPFKCLNNTDYIPYSKLTIGGVNVSDVEKEISHIPNKNIILSPILDKILSSRENSFQNDSPQKLCQGKTSKIFTTSDENLLKEVLDIEITVSKTLPKNEAIKNIREIEYNIHNSIKDSDSYADDFEDENSDASERSNQSQPKSSQSSQNLPSDISCRNKNTINPDETPKEKDHRIKCKNSVNTLTYTKLPNLSFKSSVDIFEFIHSIDTQETGTQSNTFSKIIPKETQTSPRECKPNLQPIFNNLRSSIDPRGEVENMLKLEKEIIKKLIIDEYGDLLEKSLNKPSTSGKVESELSEKNAVASQKITQTSPAHVKSVMTSPVRCKTRTTSPFSLFTAVNQQTSPMNNSPNEDDINRLEGSDLGISANLSSPRFSLRLPQTTRDILTQFDNNMHIDNTKPKCVNLKKSVPSSSSSVDADYSSSDISSLGEINKEFRRLKKGKVQSVSEISSSSSLQCDLDPSGAILPLKSDEEASVGQINHRKTKKNSKSEGEISVRQVR